MTPHPHHHHHYLGHQLELRFNSLRPSDAYICVGNLTIIGPDNGLLPGRCQAIIWTNAGILLIGPWGTNFREILISIQTFSFKKKKHLKMSSAKWRPFCLGLNVLRQYTKQSLSQWEKTGIIEHSITVYSAYPFFLWWLWEYLYLMSSSSNWKYDPFAIV